ncbi:MAG: SdrD B-like domain-containing protein [Anaerolineae bacterium]
MIRKFLLNGLLLLMLASGTLAQSSTGQLCIRAFEDRNGNGTQDANEPPIIRGISASLLDDNAVIIRTALMEESASASSGTLCFQQLSAGQYSIRVNSADYTATTPSDFTAAVNDSGVPQVLSYGGQFVPVEQPDADPATSQEARLQSTFIRSVIGIIGALVVMGAMAVIGALIYFFALRNRNPRQMPPAYRPPTATSGTYPPVSAIPSAGGTPATGTRPVGVDDTDMPNVVTAEDTYDMYSDDDEVTDDTNPPAQRVNPTPYSDAPDDDDFQFEDDDTNAPYRPPDA